MAVAGPDYKFLFINVGAYGSEGDGSVFSKTEFGESILNNTIELPEDVEIGNSKIPFVFVGDDAFPLSKRIMKPFSTPRGRPFTDSEKIFNYRLSRARRCVENAFGILTSKFLCLQRTLSCGPERAQNIVSACCLLHNFFLKNTATRRWYCPPGMADHYDANGVLIGGAWRAQTQSAVTLEINEERPNEAAKRTREIFEQFFVSPEGSIPWQRSAVFLD